MKKFFRSLVAGGALLFSVAAPAQLLSALTLTNGVNLISSSGLLAFSLQLNNPNASAVTVRLYDNDSATSTNTVKPGYTYYTWTRTLVSDIFTNVFEELQTNTYYKLLRVTNVVGAVTNEATVVYPTITVPAASSATVDFTANPIAVGRGLNALVLSSNITGFLTYLPIP